LCGAANRHSQSKGNTMKHQINIQVIGQSSKKLGRRVVDTLDFFFGEILPNVLGGIVVLVIFAKIMEAILT
jgi:hypothetical protein